MKTQMKSFSAEHILKAQKIKTLVALGINIAIAILAAVGLLWSYCINYYENMDIPHHPGQKLWFWGWFTFLSTAFIGVSCLISTAFMVRGLMKGKYEMPRFVYIIKNAAIAATILTFVITQWDTWKDLPTVHISKLQKANLIEHIIIPLLSIPCYLICERTTKMKFPETCYSMILGGLYSAHYLTVGYLNPTRWTDPTIIGDTNRYDRYGIFRMLGTKWAWVMLIGVLAVLFLFAWLTWLCNKKIHVGEGKEVKVITLKTVGIDRYYTVEKEKVVTKTVEVIKPVIKKEVVIKEVPVKVQPKQVAQVAKEVKVEKPKKSHGLSKGAIAAICAIPAGIFVVTMLLALLIK